MSTLQALAHEVDTRGFCLLPAVFSESERREMTAILRGYWERIGRPTLGGFGVAIHPLLQHLPDMAPFFAKPVVVDTVAGVLRDDVRLAHTGARLSDETSSASIGWHDHYAWDPGGLARRGKPERVLFGCYVQGSDAAAGPLVVLPRRVNEALEAKGEAAADWPGQIEIEAPPGSVVIFDTALWHTAKRGRAPGHRYLWGAHCQGWNDPRPHPEDNASTRPEMLGYLNADLRLRGMLEPPAGLKSGKVLPGRASETPSPARA